MLPGSKLSLHNCEVSLGSAGHVRHMMEHTKGGQVGLLW